MLEGSDAVLKVQTGLGEMLLRQSACMPAMWQRKQLLREAEYVLRKPYGHYHEVDDASEAAQKCSALLAGTLERQGKLQETETLLRRDIQLLERKRGPQDEICLLRQLSLSSTLAQLCTREAAAYQPKYAEGELTKCQEARLLVEWVVDGLKHPSAAKPAGVKPLAPSPQIVALAEATQARVIAAVEKAELGPRHERGTKATSFLD